MSAATELMTKYAAYHRDRRNIATVGILLARPTIAVAGWPVTPAIVLWAASTLWYLTRGNFALGLAVSLANLALILAALPLAQFQTAAWLAWGLGTFVVGWAIQFVGHYYEGKKPAFVDDIRGLLVGPMFVTGEALFALGWGKDLLAEIEARVGPTRLRDLHTPAMR
jgi:uncharacterized membrane protein YGL010W